jgi:protein-disulfide isomerase-like protein with CxxC motif
MGAARTTIQDMDATAVYEVLAIEDLVRAKKTQRDKDWPMIRRLVEAHYDENQDDHNGDVIQFWLRESRTPAMLSELVKRFPETVATVAASRPW